MSALDDFAREKLASLDASALRRTLTPTERRGRARVRRDGREYLSFSCNDYLGLSHHPEVKAAAAEATARYGAGAGGSRLVTGDHPLLGVLERRLAAHKGAETAVVFGSGYLANLGVIPALVGREDLILVDELSHSCMFAGAALSGARILRFRHNDVHQLGELLRAERAGARHVLVLSERVFSMDGDRAPTRDLAALSDAHDAWLMLDDAHGLGVVEDAVRAPLEMGTLSKALGSYGGYLCASAPVVGLLHSRARAFVYTTGLPPASAAAALAALELLEREPERNRRPLRLARRLTARLGLKPAESAIVPVPVGEARAALELSEGLAEEGFLVVAIRPPTVPPGTARLRIALSADHDEAEVDRLADRLLDLLERRG
jgi:8-amino-7-oxononanoate synthase